MITLPAVPLSPGTSKTVQIPISELGGPVGAFKVSNESPYPLTIGWAGNSQTLAPWTADVFPAPGVQTFTIAAGSGDTFAGAAALVDVAGQGESFPGSYPLSLPGQTTISGGTVEIGTISGPVTIGGNVPVENASGTQLSVSQGMAPVLVAHVPPNSTDISESANLPTSASLSAGGALTAYANGSGSDEITFTVSTEPSGTELILVENLIAAKNNMAYSLLPVAADFSVTVTATTPGSNVGNINVFVSYLPPGQVNVSEIINTPGNPVYVNLAQPSDAWALTDEPQPGAVGPSITHAPAANQSTYVTYATGGLLQNGTSPFISYCRLSGIYGGTVQNVWEGPLGVDGVAGHSAQCPPFSGGAIKFDVGAEVTLSLSGQLPADAVYGMLSMLGFDQ